MSAPHNAKDLLAGSEDDADDVDFDDPDAWGFCRYCAFDVAVTLNSPRLMLPHGRTDYGWIKRPCYGGDREPTEAPGKEATPVPTPEEEVEDE